MNMIMCSYKTDDSTDTVDKPHQCEICGKVFTYRNRLIRHMFIHSEDKLYTCEICGKTFTRNFTLKEHLLKHSGDKLQKCGICGKSYTYSSALSKHKRVHTRAQTYNSENCESDNLDRQMKVYTEDKQYNWETCGKTFKHSFTLKEHRLIHSGDKPQKCGICGKSLAQRSALSKHKRVHTRTQIDNSRNCFSDNPDRQMKVYTEDKSYSCETCGKTFARNFTLKEHLLIHSGEKPQQCGICGKSFAQRSTLTKHKRVHAKAKTDNSGNSMSGNLDKLMGDNAEDKPYSCGICGKSFVKESKLKDHLVIHTNHTIVEYVELPS